MTCMTQDVLLTISGLHDMVFADPEENEENEPIEVITPASYYWKNGKHYILYDEVMEGIPGVVKNKIKITGEDSMEIMKSGITNAHMVFEKNQMNVTYYDTPYGQLHVGIHTRKLDVNVDDERIDIAVEYGLDVNHEATADCRIAMSIRPKAQRKQFQENKTKRVNDSISSESFTLFCYLFRSLAQNPFFLGGVSREPLTPFTAVM